MFNWKGIVSTSVQLYACGYIIFSHLMTKEANNKGDTTIIFVEPF